MRNPDSNILAATLSVPIVVLSRLPNSILALSFFIMLWSVHFSYIYQFFLVNQKI